MEPELSDKFVDVEAGERRETMPVPGEVIFSANVNTVVSAEAVRKVYDYYFGVLGRYDSGQIEMDDLKANKIRSNTKTVGLILERVKHEEYETAQQRLRRAEILMQEIMQAEGIEGFVLYRKADGKYN